MKTPAWLPKFGDLPKSTSNPAEDYVLSSLISRIRNDYPSTYGLVAFHVKNESKRTTGQIRADKAKGLTKGVSDLIVIGNPTLCMEIKKDNSCRFEDGQLEFLQQAQKQGAFVCLAIGYQGAKDAFEEWRILNENNSQQCPE